MVSIFHGCVPVFSLGKAQDDDALPFDELLPWSRFSLRVPIDNLRALPAVVRGVARDGPRLREMQAELGCVWRALFWTSLKGSCFGEGVRGDAFDALMAVLARRREPAPEAAASACDAAARPLPAHLRGADGALDTGRFAVGTSWVAARAEV
jgi:hypothetical protein